MSTFKLKKGYNIKIVGSPKSELIDAPIPDYVAIKPSDFPGIKPKLCIAEGAQVKAGTPLFYSKADENVKFTSPVSGKVEAIVRGERRSLKHILIKPDANDDAESFESISGDVLVNTPADQILETIMKSGLLGCFLQRPFGIIPNPKITPRDIFVSAYLTGPLSPDINLILLDNEASFQAGLTALSRLTEGAVHLSLEDGREDLSDALKKANNVQIHKFKGPHPAGNVGIQIHHISPINKGDVVWTINCQGVINIGKLFLEGRLNSEKVVAVAGENAQERKHFKTISGAAISSLLQDKYVTENSRLISGDVLSGTKVEADDYLCFNDNLVSVIPECHSKEFMGWMKPGLNKESFSKFFLSFLSKEKKYSHNTGYHGGVRAFVQTGYYEKVIPMDLFPDQLLKCILYKDIEEMEGLGILEVIEEDLALCDYICISKIEIQQILREGLDFYRKETT